MMPQMNGLELLGVLRSTPATEDIPIILLSVRADEESRIEGLAAGADDYLTKPFSARELLARIEATLKLAKLRRLGRDRERVLQQETDTAKTNLEQIVSGLRDGFVTFDRQWRYTYINQRLLEILNLPKEAVIGRYSWEVFPLGVSTEFYTLLARAMNEQIEVQFEFYYSQLNCWVEHRIYPTTDGLALLMADITDRKRAELLLVEQKHLLESVAAGEPLADCLSALCTSISKLSQGVRACIPIAATTPHKWPAIVAPGFDSLFDRGWQDAPLNADLMAVPFREAFAGVDLTADDCGSPAWRDLLVAHGILACHSTPILSADDLCFGALWLCFDRPRLPSEWEYRLVEFGTNIASIVFDRDLANLALQTSEAKYRTLFESMDEGWCICQMLFDEHGTPNDYRFIEVNSAFGNLTGLTGAVGQTARELVPDLEAEWFEIYGRVALTGEPIRFENQSIALNRWFDVNAFATGEPGRHQFTSLFTNITDRKQTEIALQSSEQRLRISQLAAKIGTWEWDLITGDVIWSPEYYALYGLDPATPATYENWLTHVIATDRQSAESAVRDALERQQTYLEFEFRIVHPIQGIRWFSSRSQIFYNDSRQPLRAIGISIDITDRKQVEEALRDSEQRFRNMADNAPMIVWVTDATGRCTYLSRSWYEFSGQLQTERLGPSWIDATHPDDREFSKQTFLSAHRQREAFQMEYRLRRHDGEYRTCIDVGRPWFGTDGDFKGYIGSVIDINDRKQMEATLAERARELSNLLPSLRLEIKSWIASFMSSPTTSKHPYARSPISRNGSRKILMERSPPILNNTWIGCEVESA
jgi:PAS domain S-box-containing protein